jgi:hypothetical protein
MNIQLYLNQDEYITGLSLNSYQLLSNFIMAHYIISDVKLKGFVEEHSNRLYSLK